jgi:hypothetical protein
MARAYGKPGVRLAILEPARGLDRSMREEFIGQGDLEFILALLAGV